MASAVEPDLHNSVDVLNGQLEAHVTDTMSAIIDSSILDEKCSESKLLHFEPEEDNNVERLDVTVSLKPSESLHCTSTSDVNACTGDELPSIHLVSPSVLAIDAEETSEVFDDSLCIGERETPGIVPEQNMSLEHAEYGDCDTIAESCVVSSSENDTTAVTSQLLSSSSEMEHTVNKEKLSDVAPDCEDVDDVVDEVLTTVLERCDISNGSCTSLSHVSNELNLQEDTVFAPISNNAVEKIDSTDMSYKLLVEETVESEELCATTEKENEKVKEASICTVIVEDNCTREKKALPSVIEEEQEEINSNALLLPPSPPVPVRRRSVLQSTPVTSPSVPPRRRSVLYASQTSINRKSVNNSLPRSPLVTKEASKPAKKRSMFSWIGGDSSKKKNKEVLETVSEGLRKIYKQKLHPLEEHYKFHEFHSPALDDPDFDAKPMILLVGQYSTGKTTFIRFLLEKDFPGIRIGPEPTTDRFIAVMHGDEEGVIPGNALVVDAKKQFRALSGFGNAFLNRFQCSTLPNQVLESVTIVDTPGILSGEKQRIDRGYDFTGVLEWFAERVDRIILLFDAHKLDISDEFKRCIEALSGNEDKIRIVLNKSDMVDHQQLMRVYGALMWSLGKVFRTPEVARVYIGSFWDQPLHYDINRRLFQDEQQDLFQDLQALPRNAALRKLNDLIKRARLAKVHAYIIAELRKQMPSMIGKEKKKKELIQNLDKIFDQLQREHNISPGDFPDVNKMREKLQNQDFTKFNPIKPKLLEVVDGMLASDIARLMAQIPKEEQAMNVSNGITEQPSVKGGAFSNAQETETPFGFGKGEGFDKGADENEWVVNRERNSADSTFNSLGPVNGYLSGRVAKEHMVKSKLPNAVLGKIWKLADVDKDGQLDNDEFALANYLINLKLEGHELPNELPGHLIPPSKRNADAVYPTLDDE
ncbi:unnamed protein product [Auanema sp. JU1783]|nr:unnamed protein product [Auanema sp. JU1783]